MSGGYRLEQGDVGTELFRFFVNLSGSIFPLTQDLVILLMACRGVILAQADSLTGNGDNRLITGFMEPIFGQFF